MLRRRRGRDQPASSCPGCTAPLPVEARWCGGCGRGLAVEDTDQAHEGGPGDDRAGEVRDDEPPSLAGDGRSAAGRRRALLATGLAVVVVGGALLADRGPAPASLLGRADLRPSLVATGPPPSGELRLAWEHVPDEDQEFALGNSGGTGQVVDGVMDVGGRTGLDLATGRLLTLVAQSEGPAGTGLLVDDDELLSVDVRSGSVLSRRSLPALGDGVRLLQVLGSTDAGLLVRVAPDDHAPGAPPEVLVLDDDLDVVRRLPDGRLVAGRWLLRTVDDGQDGGAGGDDPGRAGVPLEVVDDGPFELLDLADGRVVARGPQLPEGPLVPLGGRLVGVVERRLVDVLADGGSRPLGVEEGAVLLGSLDGRLVVALDGFGPTWEVALVDPTRPGAPQVLGEVADATVGGRALPQRVGVGDGHVVVAQDGAVIAWDAAGQQAWVRPVLGAGRVVVAAGHVLAQPGGEQQAPRGGPGDRTVLDVADGSTVWATAGRDTRTAPVAAVDGRVLLGARGWFMVGQQRLGTWIDVADGTTTPPPDGVVPPLQDSTGPSLVGLVPVAGQPVPVVWALGQQDQALVSVSGAPLQEVAALSSARDVPGGQLPSPFVVGAVPDALLVQRPVPGVADEQPPLLRVDLADGGATELQGVSGTGGGWVDDGLLLLREGGELVAVEPGTTAPAWSVPTDGLRPVGVTGDAVVLAGPTRLQVLERADGQVRVDRQLEAVAVASELAGDLLLRRMPDGRVVAVGLGDGDVRWSTGSGAAPVSTTAVMGDHLLLGTVDGRVVELAGDGRVVRDLEVGTGPVGSLALVDGTLVVTVDGVVRGFRADATGVVESDRVDVPDAP